MRSTLWLALAFLPISAPAFAEASTGPPHIYRWIDETGVAHYTTDLERVPKTLRDQPLRREELSAQAPATVDSWVQHERVPEPPKAAAGGTTLSPGSRVSELNARIVELEQAIAADESLLKSDLTDPNAPASNTALKEVAERMPDRIAELKKLQAERDALGAPSAE